MVGVDVVSVVSDCCDHSHVGHPARTTLEGWRWERCTRVLDTLESALERLYRRQKAGCWLAFLRDRFVYFVGVNIPFDCMVIAAVLYRYALSVPFLCQYGGASYAHIRMRVR